MEKIEFIENEHLYLCDGIIIPSITQILSVQFPFKYESIPKEILEKAAERGTAIHRSIESGVPNNNYVQEFENYTKIIKENRFENIEHEIQVLLKKNNDLIAIGRLDIIATIDNDLSIIDIKTTSKLDQDYLKYQLNFYRTAYQQTFNKEVKKLYGIWLRKDKYKLVEIPIDENIVNETLEKWERAKEDEQSDFNW